MIETERHQLRVLIANEKRDRLELLAQVVIGLGHDVIAREIYVKEVGTATAREHPDVALVGLGSSSDHALELISEIVREASCPVIAILHAADPDYVHEAARRGVFAYIIDGTPEELQSAIDITLQRFAEYQNLQGAFGRRALIEQAKGILMARHAIGADRVTGHQDALRLLDHGPATERSLQVVVLPEALQGDVESALQLLGRGVHDVGEDAPPRRLAHVGRVLHGQQGDHRAGGLADDLGDQLERVIRGQAEADESHVGMLACGDRGDLAHVDLTRDHLVAEPGHNLGEQLEPVAPLVRDQDAKMLALVLEHRRNSLVGPLYFSAARPRVRGATSSLVARVEGRTERCTTSRSHRKRPPQPSLSQLSLSSRAARACAGSDAAPASTARRSRSWRSSSS